MKGDTEGPYKRRFKEFSLLRMFLGAIGERSQDVHYLIGILAKNRVRTLELKGESPGPHQLGLEVT